ncbi:MAG TPA: hypothetical protein ENN76_03200, partial [Euryarchaeota archaeon]|nr:hypothetical protein [Euryarchaeota archaeon]
MAIRADNKGRVPFALVGVLVLLMASGAGVYLNYTYFEQGQKGTQRQVMSDARFVISSVSADASIRAQRLLVNTFEESLEWRVDVNDDESFFKDMEKSFSLLYPFEMDGFVVDVKLHNALLFSKKGVLGGSDSSHTPPLPYAITALVDFNITLSGRGINLVDAQKLTVTAPVFDILFNGLFSHIEHLSDTLAVDTFGYLISLLVQKRTLEGWGSSDGMPGLNDIITAKEAEHALNVSLRTLSVAMNGIDPHTGKNYTLFDPGDIFLKELGETEFDVSKVVSQALSGIIDQLVIKYFEYLGVAGGIDAYIETAATLNNWVSNLWVSIVGDEKTDEKNQAVKSWVAKIFDNADIKLWEYAGPDLHTSFFSSAPAATFVVTTDSNLTYTMDFSGTSRVDFPFFNPLTSNGWDGLFQSFENSYHSSHDTLQSLLNSLIDALVAKKAMNIPLILNPLDDISPIEEIRRCLKEPFSSDDILKDLILECGSGHALLTYSTLDEVGDWIFFNREKIYNLPFMTDYAVSRSAQTYVSDYLDHHFLDIDGTSILKLEE